MKITGRMYWGLTVLLLLVSVSSSWASHRGNKKEDITKFGGSVHVESGENAGGDAVAFGGSVTVDGSVEGDVVAFGGGADINGSVAGDVVVFGGDLRLGAGASVGGDVVVFGGSVHRDPTATIGGEVKQFGGFWIFGAGTIGILGLLLVIGSVFGIVLYLLCYAIAGRPRIETITAVASRNLMNAALYGLGIVAVGVALILGAAFGLSGGARVLVLVAVGLCLLVVAMVGNTAVALWLGRTVAKSAGPVGAIALGALLLILIQFVPLAGALAHIFLQLVGLGAAALTGLGSSPGGMQENVFGHAPPPAA